MFAYEISWDCTKFCIDCIGLHRDYMGLHETLRDCTKCDRDCMELQSGIAKDCMKLERIVHI